MSIDKTVDIQILNITQSHEIFEQSDLQKLLREKGVDIPQATLSRHLKKLKIAKISGIYKSVEPHKANVPLILNIQVSEFGLIVLHTHPGNANSLAYYIDQKYVTCSPQNPKNLSILGTIAGDDTVLLICKSNDSIKDVLSILKEEFPYLTIN